MADMEGNTGKDIAFEKLKNFEDKVKNDIKKSKNKEEGIILLENSAKTEKNAGIELEYKKVKGKYIFSLGDKEIFTMDEKGIFTYNTENINAINEDKNNSIKNLEDSIGLPKIAEIERIKEEEKEQNGQKEHETGDDAEKADEEKPELDEEEKEQADEDKNKSEIAAQLGIDKSKIIEIDTERKLSDQGALANLVSGFDISGKYYIAEDKDNPYNYHILRKNEKTEQLEDVNMKQKMLQQTEGKNPTEKILKIDKDGNMTEVTARAMYMDPKNKNVGIAITHDEHGRVETMYYRRLPNDRYVAQVVPEKSVKNRENTNSETVRDMMDSRYTNNVELQKQTDLYDESQEISKNLSHDVDYTKDGTNVTETKTYEDLKETIIKEFMEDLKSKDGIDNPIIAEKMAREMFDKVVKEGQTYENAKEQTIEASKRPSDNSRDDDDDHIPTRWPK